jgi:four helix bundle protein
MSKTVYESLEIYRLAEQLANTVWKSVRNWESFEKNTLGRQLVRAADSIGANIAEGFGRGSCADQKRFMRIARGSAYEAKHWLRLALRRGLPTEECVSQLKPLLDKLPPKLNAYMRAVGRKKDFDNRQSTIDNQ